MSTVHLVEYLIRKWPPLARHPIAVVARLEIEYEDVED